MSQVEKKRAADSDQKVPTPEFSTERNSNPDGSTCAGGGIDVHEAVCGVDRSSYPPAQRDILGQHLFCAFKRELAPVDALPGIGDFQGQDIGRRPGTVGFCGVHGPLNTWRAISFPDVAVGLDLYKARSSLAHTPLRTSDPAAQRDAEDGAAIVTEHFLGTFQGAFRPAHAHPGARKIKIHIKHLSGSLLFAVPSRGQPSPIALVPAVRQSGQRGAGQ